MFILLPSYYRTPYWGLEKNFVPLCLCVPIKMWITWIPFHFHDEGSETEVKARFHPHPAEWQRFTDKWKRETGFELFCKILLFHRKVVYLQLFLKEQLPAPSGDSLILPSHRRGGAGVGSVFRNRGSILGRFQRLQTPPLTPPLEGRGAQKPPL